MIPKKLHIVWIGEEGTRPDGCIDSWRQLNPEYDVVLWGNAELAEGQWTNRDHMRELLAHDVSGVMDLMRYEILLREGGISVDALSIANRPLADWLLEAEAFACWQDELDELGIISTAILGAEPGAAVLRQVIQDVHQLATVTDRPARDSIGSRRLTKSWRASRAPLTIHPSHYFAPTKGEVCLYTGSGIMFAERLLPADQASATDHGLPESLVAHDFGSDRSLLGEFRTVEAPRATTADAASNQSFEAWANSLGAGVPADSAWSDSATESASSDYSNIGAQRLPVLVGATAAANGQRLISSELGYSAGVPATTTTTEQRDTWAAPVLSSSPETASILTNPPGFANGLGTDAGPTTAWGTAVEPEKRFRLLVATDWSSATVPLAVLKAYHEMIPADAPVDLVFSLPHQPGAADVDCLEVLLNGVGAEGDSAGLLLESHDESAAKSCFGAVIPNGNRDAVTMQLVQLLTAMHHLADLVRSAERLAKEPAPVDGFNAGLQGRLSSYAEVTD